MNIESMSLAVEAVQPTETGLEELKALGITSQEDPDARKDKVGGDGEGRRDYC